MSSLRSGGIERYTRIDGLDAKVENPKLPQAKLEKSKLKDVLKGLFEKEISLEDIESLLSDAYDVYQDKSIYDIFIQQFFSYHRDYTRMLTAAEFDILLEILKQSSPNSKCDILANFDPHIDVVLRSLVGSDVNYSKKILEFLDVINEASGAFYHSYGRFLLIYYLAVNAGFTQIDVADFQKVLHKCDYSELMVAFYYKHENLESIFKNGTKETYEQLPALLGPISFGECFQKMCEDGVMKPKDIEAKLMIMLPKNIEFRNKCLELYRLVTEPKKLFKENPEIFMGLLANIIPSTQEIVMRSRDDKLYFNENFKKLIVSLETILEDKAAEKYAAGLHAILANLYHARAVYKGNVEKHQMKSLQHASAIPLSESKSISPQTSYDLGMAILGSMLVAKSHHDPLHMQISAMTHICHAAANGHTKAAEHFKSKDVPKIPYSPSKFGAQLVESKVPSFESKAVAFDVASVEPLITDLLYQRVEDLSGRLYKGLSSLKMKSRMSHDVRDIALKHLGALVNCRKESLDLLGAILPMLKQNLKMILSSKDIDMHRHLEGIVDSINQLAPPKVGLDSGIVRGLRA